MQVKADQLQASALVAFGRQATQLLGAADFSGLAQRFDYVFNFGRDPAFAIREDLQASLAQLDSSGLVMNPPGEPSITYFQINSSGLLALVEQRIPTENGKYVLVELIVRGTGSDIHIELEQISALS
jgi:hypothetical protein